jgi:hypothetical protein
LTSNKDKAPPVLATAARPKPLNVRLGMPHPPPVVRRPAAAPPPPAAAPQGPDNSQPATPAALVELRALRADLAGSLPEPWALGLAAAAAPTAPPVWVAWDADMYAAARRRRALVLGRDEWTVLTLGTCLDVASSAYLWAMLGRKRSLPHLSLTREWLCAGYAHTPVVIAQPSVGAVCASWGLVIVRIATSSQV